jgi:hypothetical protein
MKYRKKWQSYLGEMLACIIRSEYMYLTSLISRVIGSGKDRNIVRATCSRVPKDNCGICSFLYSAMADKRADAAVQR